ncbi:hypothetical protein AAG570_004002 [Ranatra chinensis]|uniref:Protein OSCP1 n=1 Tax=Ranatra chinensis TaxID=642074 RepID=A0ABD0Y389_9HEMI
MAQYTLPFLFINLGGEMIYILDQRLRAQNIAVEKSRKVLNEIVGIMFNPRFMEELFKPQEVYNKAALKSLFHDLAHASIMRLNDTSMSKLYDLMTMVFKWQVFLASHPKELVLITLNHLDGMRSVVTMANINKQLDTAYFMLIKTCGQMSCGELQAIRYSLLNFLQDVRVRVSLLLRQGLQNPDGSFVISPNLTLFYGSEVPGKMRIFSKDGYPVDLINFYSGGCYSVASQPGSTELRGIRNTSLGTNIYSTSRVDAEKKEYYCGNENLRREIDLLVTQLGGDNRKVPEESFPLQLFDLQEEQFHPDWNAAGSSSTVPTALNAENPHKDALNKILSEMQPSIPKDQSHFDLLDLMDELT